MNYIYIMSKYLKCHLKWLRTSLILKIRYSIMFIKLFFVIFIISSFIWMKNLPFLKVGQNISVQSAKKERTNELNSKFDKTYKIFSKSYHNLISKENYCLFAWLIISLISHFISFTERHVFNLKACLLFIKKFMLI